MAVTIFLFSIVSNTLATSSSLANEIHKVAKAGNVDKLVSLLSQGIDADEADGSGETPLFVAAKWGQVEAVKILLAAGADPSIAPVGPFGSLGTALHAAAKGGRTEIVRILLSAGMDPNFPDAGAGPPLHIALSRNRKDVADLLVSHGAGPVAAEPVDRFIAEADLTLGEKVAGTCRVCHELTKGGQKKIGPPLWNVVDREKASLPGFEYSTTLLNSGGVWNYADLNSFLANPRAFMPGTKMSTLSGIASPERRAALLLYLRSLSDAPKPLP